MARPKVVWQAWALWCLCLLFPFWPSLAEETPVVISEIMVQNRLLPVEGKTSAWVEIWNRGKTDINLDGWGLSDRENLPHRVGLSGTLRAGQYRCVPLGEDTGIVLKPEKGALYLTDQTQTLCDRAAYTALPADAALMRQGSLWLTTFCPTPGEANRFLSRLEQGQAAFDTARDSGLWLTEIMTASDAFGKTYKPPDWAEIYNGSENTLPLHGLWLTDDREQLKKWAFPLRSTLKKGARAVVYFSDEAIGMNGRDTYLCTAFTLNKGGGALILSDGEKPLDAVSWPRQWGGVSYGRPGDKGAFRYLNEQTLQVPNPLKGYGYRLNPVVFSKAGGFCEAPFSLALESAAGADIYYTLDGSEPTALSARYTGPIPIEKGVSVRAIARKNGYIDAPVATQSYLFDAGLPELTVCLSGKAERFFGGHGLFERGREGLKLEVAGNMEIWENGQSVLNRGVGLHLTGGTSLTYLPRTFTFYARPGLGDGDFVFSPFEDREYPAFASLTLRGTGQDYQRGRFRDAFLCSLAKGYGVMYLASRPASVYINGQYWGHMNLRERANQRAIAQWEGITDDETIEQIAIIKNRGVAVKGNRKELDDLAAFCRQNDLNDEKNLRYVQSQLDINSLFAHTAFQIICGNQDLENMRYYRVPGGKWKVMLFDLDLTFLHTNMGPLDFYLGDGRQPTRYFYGELFTSLMRVPAMREKFLMLMGRILHERFAPDTIHARLLKWKETYRPLVEKHVVRWPAMTMDRWEKSVTTFDTMLVKRPQLVVRHLQKGYRLSDEDMQRYFGDYLRDIEPQQ